MEDRWFFRYLATGIQNLAVIALGLGLFEGKTYPLVFGLVVAVSVSLIAWRLRL